MLVFKYPKIQPNAFDNDGKLNLSFFIQEIDAVEFQKAIEQIFANRIQSGRVTDLLIDINTQLVDAGIDVIAVENPALAGGIEFQATELGQFALTIGEFDPGDTGLTVDQLADALGSFSPDTPSSGSSSGSSFDVSVMGGASATINLNRDFTSPADPEIQLDLARAYISMGDKEAARVILEEVIAHGSDEQKTEAGKMKDML